MLLIRTYMHNSRKIAFRRAANVCMHYCIFIGDEGSNQFVSHSVVLNCSFMDLLVASKQ